MSRQLNRLQKLESPKTPQHIISLVFYRISDGGHGKPITTRLEVAKLTGVDHPMLKRGENETEGQFLHRVYEKRAETWPWDRSADLFRQTSAAGLSEAAALELYLSGQVSD